MGGHQRHRVWRASLLLLVPLLSSADPVEAAATPDAAEFERLLQGLEWASDRVVMQRRLFEELADPQHVPTLAERQKLIRVWADLYTAFADLEHSVAPPRPGATPAAERLRYWTRCGAMLIHGRRALALVGDSSTLAILLEEQRVGKPGRRETLSALRNSLHRLPDSRSLLHAIQYDTCGGSAAPCDAVETGVARFWQAHRADLVTELKQPSATTTLSDSAVAISARGSVASLQDAILIPIETFFGRAKTRRGRGPLITPADVAQVLPRLEPGDIQLERTSWIMSGLFITGFWGHGAIHTGTLAEASAYFDTPEIRARMQEMGAPDFEALVRQRYPEAVASWLSPAPDGQPRRVFEGEGSVSETIFFNSASNAYVADYSAFLRPRQLSRLDKALAIIDAMAYFGRPYDFAFDMRSDEAVVCTELVAKAYAEGPGKRGLRFQVAPGPLGRWVVYPNGIAEMYAREHAAGDMQFTLIDFLAGSERTGQVRHASEDDFLASSRWGENGPELED